MDIFRTVQYALNYLVNSDTRKEHKEGNHRRDLIKQALEDNKYFKTLSFDKELENEVLIQILNEIRKSITSSVLDKKTRKYILSDLVQTDEERINNYTKIINNVCIEQIINTKVDAELVYNKHLSKNNSDILKQLLLNCLYSLDPRDLLHQAELLCPLTSKVFNSIKILDEYVLGIQPMTNPVGIGFKQVPNKLGAGIEKYTTSAFTRKLHAVYRYELSMDTTYHSEINDIIVELFEKEISTEIVSELIHQLYEVSNKIGVEEVRFEKAGLSAIPYTIKNIPNFVIVNYLGFKLLQDTQPSFNVLPFGSNVINRVGYFTSPENTMINVLLTDVAEFDDQSNAVLLYGHKGYNAFDVGLIYHPYILCLFGNTMTNEKTFEPISSILTRYDLTPNTDNIEYYNFSVIEHPYER